jgi:hypothetical protein
MKTQKESALNPGNTFEDKRLYRVEEDGYFSSKEQ